MFSCGEDFWLCQSLLSLSFSVIGCCCICNSEVRYYWRILIAVFLLLLKVLELLSHPCSHSWPSFSLVRWLKFQLQRVMAFAGNSVFSYYAFFSQLHPFSLSSPSKALTTLSPVGYHMMVSPGKSQRSPTKMLQPPSHELILPRATSSVQWFFASVPWSSLSSPLQLRLVPARGSPRHFSFSRVSLRFRRRTTYMKRGPARFIVQSELL